MKDLLRGLHRASSGAETSHAHRCASSRFGRVVQRDFVSALKPISELPESFAQNRKRDRLKKYLNRQPRSRTEPNMMSFPLPAIQSTEKGMAETLYVTYGDDADVIKVPSESDSEGKYVIPPVEIPDMYNRKDRHGGITVAGARVVFTYAGFKRQQMILVKLQSVPELADQFAEPLGGTSCGCVVVNT